MIKINLLDVEKVKAGARPEDVAAGIKRERKAPEDKKKNIIFGVIIGGALALIALWYFTMSGKLGSLEDQKAEKKRELARVEVLIKEVEKFRARRAELQKQINLIEDLKKRQEGPADLMKRVYLAMPERVFLKKIEQKGDNIKVFGEALTESSVAAFYEEIRKSPHFIDVKPRDYTVEEQLVVFELACTFVIDPEARAKKLAAEKAKKKKRPRFGAQPGANPKG